MYGTVRHTCLEAEKMFANVLSVLDPKQLARQPVRLCHSYEYAALSSGRGIRSAPAIPWRVISETLNQSGQIGNGGVGKDFTNLLTFVMLASYEIVSILSCATVFCRFWFGFRSP